MSPQIFTQEWIDDAVEAATSDPDFRQRVQALTSSLHLRDENAGFTLSFAPDNSVQVTPGEEAGADFVLRGTREQWDTALRTARDLGGATASGLTLTGDQFALAGNAVALSRFWLALQGALPESPAPTSGVGGNEADPVGSAIEIVGRYVQIGQYRTYYEAAGTGRPVICIHTGGADGREFRHLIPHLAARGYRAIALDMPGHGKSYPDLKTLQPIRRTADWINFVLQFSRELGLDKPVYVGCAMSGSLLLELAADHPDCARAVVSANGTIDFTDMLSADFLGALNHPQINVSDFLQAITPGLIGPALPLEARNESSWQNARNLTPEVMHADMRIYAAHNVRTRLSEIRIPVLHIRCEYDTTVRDQDSAAIAEKVQEATLVRLPGVGHLPMVEGPDQFNRAVATFLDTLDRNEQFAPTQSALTNPANRSE